MIRILLFMGLCGMASLFCVNEVQAVVKQTRVEGYQTVCGSQKLGEGNTMLSIDFNLDGVIDLHIGEKGYLYTSYVYAYCDPYNGGLVVQTPPEGSPASAYKDVWAGAIPLGTTIGDELESSVDLSSSNYVWEYGLAGKLKCVYPYDIDYPWQYNYTRPGNASGIVYRATLAMIFNLPDDQTPESECRPFGNLPGTEGVIGFKFYPYPEYGPESKNPVYHFGYVHFDYTYHKGTHRVMTIYGWAYETEFKKAIVAEPLNNATQSSFLEDRVLQFSAQKNEKGGLNISWQAVPGATYQLERATAVNGPFESYGEEIIPKPELGANMVTKVVTVSKEECEPHQSIFWRVKRLK